MEAIEQVPKTALEVFRLLPEGTLCEVINNVLYMSPAPKYDHQRLVRLFTQKISNYLDNTNIGELIISPFDVYFEELLSAVQPDLLVVLNENRHILKEDGYIHGAPDIIIEVLSGDKKRDLVKKKNLYEKAGVKEYFAVDPQNSEINSWLLKENKYEIQYSDFGKFKSSVLSIEFKF
ncbi:MAG TPA: Uma2 family endonuclease [Segetibacter sp.]|jgi:Uma2 family endonuclease|nr:Uma2 family endonuclease [Segetibacter sp.]